MRKITTAEAVEKMGLNSAASLYNFCSRGCVHGYTKSPAEDKYSNGEYSFYSNMRWAKRYRKSHILKICLLRKIPNAKIKDILGSDGFKSFNRYPVGTYFDVNSFVSPLLKRIGLSHIQ